jgi:F-type H+-transporting ATPase subunit epsilon
VTLQVQLVAADRSVWSGEASMVITRTVDGDIGVLPGHEPLLAELASGVVVVKTTESGEVTAAVHGGFISVDADTVSLLAEVAELSHEIDVDRARKALDEAANGSASDDDDANRAAQARAETRLRAAEARI